MANPRTQKEYRRSLNPKDQFGRKWLVKIEINTGEPTGAIYPAWPPLPGTLSPDPLRTPMNFIRIPKNEDNQFEMGKVRIDFDGWITQQAEAEELWTRQLYTNARQLYKKLDVGDVRTLQDDPYIVEATGSRPWPPVAVLKAAKGGHKGFLGLEPLKPEDRKALRMETGADLEKSIVTPEPVSDVPAPPDQYNSFVGWAMSYGGAKNLTEAAALWSTHKANLAAA